MHLMLSTDHSGTWNTLYKQSHMAHGPAVQWATVQSVETALHVSILQQGGQFQAPSVISAKLTLQLHQVCT